MPLHSTTCEFCGTAFERQRAASDPAPRYCSRGCVNRATKRKYAVGQDVHSRLYRIWRCMHFRCYQPSHEAYHRYGGRGIGVCDEWRDFGGFSAWALANGYAEDLTIDREDNDLGYEPSNCRWVTMADQQRNRRDVVPVTAFGETKCIAEWQHGPRCTVSMTVLHRRLKAGMDPEAAITKPPREQREIRPALLTAFGETKTVGEWANDPRCAVDYGTLYVRFRENWDGEEAVSGIKNARSTQNLGRYATARPIFAFGEWKRITEWARDPRSRVTRKGLERRIKRGMSAEDAITTPHQPTGPKPRPKATGG